MDQARVGEVANACIHEATIRGATPDEYAEALVVALAVLVKACEPDWPARWARLSRHQHRLGLMMRDLERAEAA